MIEWRARATWALLALFWAGAAHAQTDGLLQIGDGPSRFLERQQAAGLLPEAHLSHQPISAYDAAEYFDTLERRRRELSASDRVLLDRYRGVSARGRRGWWFANGQDWFSAEGKDWAVQLNPLILVAYGSGSQSDGPRPTVWQHSRGARISGRIGPHVFFEGRFTENQERVVNPVESAPRRSGLVRRSDVGYDWMEAVGVAGFRSRYFEIRFGRDRNRWGDATGSTLLSNYAPPYDQLQIRTRFWRLEYVSLFAGFSSTPAPEVAHIIDQVRRRKYGSLHRLALKLPGRVELSVFESVIFATDSLKVRARFDPAYLNPVIFFRPVERDRGSPDNVMLGAGLAWQALPGVRLYGSMLLDEYVPGHVGDGFWNNKWAFSWGAHVANWPVDGLSVRAEATRLRPFLYSHSDEINAYVHLNDALGHPAGPNAWDYALLVDWQVTPRIHGAVNLAYTRRGRNADGINYGSDPTADYDSRDGDENHFLLQGVRQNLWLIEAWAGYEFLPGVTAEAALRFASTDDAETGINRFVTPFLQIRWGLPFPSVRY